MALILVCVSIFLIIMTLVFSVMCALWVFNKFLDWMG